MHSPDSNRPPSESQSMKLRHESRRVGWAAGAGLLLLLAGLFLIVRPLLAQQAGLTLTQTSSNQFQLTLTNATVGETYVIYRRVVLGDANYPWQFYLLGSPSQVVFTVDMGIDQVSYFQSISGTNWDSVRRSIGSMPTRLIQVSGR